MNIADPALANRFKTKRYPRSVYSIRCDRPIHLHNCSNDLNAKLVSKEVDPLADPAPGPPKPQAPAVLPRPNPIWTHLRTCFQ